MDSGLSDGGRAVATIILPGRTGSRGRDPDAEKHFKEIRLDYSIITDTTFAWWLASDQLPAQDRLDIWRSYSTE